jgi:hypothetical protein
MYYVHFHIAASQAHTLMPKTSIPIASIWNISVTHEFNIGIMDFVRDIKDSVNRASVYLDLLEKTPHLQEV